MTEYTNKMLNTLESLYHLTFDVATQLATKVEYVEDVPANLEFNNLNDLEQTLLRASSDLNKVCAYIINAANANAIESGEEGETQIADIVIGKEELDLIKSKYLNKSDSN